MGIFLVSDGAILGVKDESRLLALPFYKRLFAKICRKYRMRYTDMKPFKITTDMQE